MSEQFEAETSVPTDRAERYLVQICEHLDHLRGRAHRHGPGRHGSPPDLRDIHRTEQQGSITFESGRITLTATNDALTIHVLAEDAGNLDRLKSAIADRVETIGRRDRLRVNW